MIIEKELIVNNRKKVDIVAELRKKEFVPFPKVVKNKPVNPDADEEAEEESDEEDGLAGPNGATSDFDYLLGMAIYSLTREKIEKFNNQAREKEDQLLAMLKRTPHDLWNEDLDNFMDEWEVSTFEVRYVILGAQVSCRTTASTLRTRPKTASAKARRGPRKRFAHESPSVMPEETALTTTTSNQSRRMVLAKRQRKLESQLPNHYQ